MKRKRGFTLVEIMIVVAIIALLAAIAIPNLLRARLQANESAAQAAIKTLATAEITYRTANPSYGSLSDLGSATPPYIDAVLAAGTKNGYLFTATGAAESFFATAAPASANVTGVRLFCVTEDGVVRVAAGGSTVPTSRDACLTSPFGATQP